MKILITANPTTSCHDDMHVFLYMDNELECLCKDYLFKEAMEVTRCLWTMTKQENLISSENTEDISRSQISNT